MDNQEKSEKCERDSHLSARSQIFDNRSVGEAASDEDCRAKFGDASVDRETE